MFWVKPLGTLTTLAMAVVFACAQSAPTEPAAPVAASVGNQDPNAKPAEPKKGDNEEDEVGPAKLNRLEVGFFGWDPSGNRAKLNHYARTPNGFFLKDLRLYTPAGGLGTWATFGVRGWNNSDRATDGRLIFSGGRGSIQAKQQRANFFDDSASPVLPSYSETDAIDVRFALTSDVNLFWNYDGTRKLDRFEAPKDPRKSRTRTWQGGVQGKFLGGDVSATMGERQYYDRTSNHPDTRTRMYNLSYGRDITSNLNLEGMFQRSDIHVAGDNPARLDRWGINANLDLGPRTSLSGFYRSEDYDSYISDVSHVQQRFMGGARLYHQLGGANVQLGYKFSQTERVRSDFLYVDVPTYHTYDMKVRGQVLPRIQGSVKAAWTHMTGKAVMLTADPRQLYWDDRVRSEARLDYAQPNFQAYAAYRFRFDQNDGRNVELDTHDFVFGGSLQLSETTGTWFEIARTSYRSRGANDEVGYALDDFFPSTTTLAVGFETAVAPTQSLSAALNYYVTNNKNPLELRDGNVRGTEITATYRYQLRSGTLNLIVAPWRYRDRIVDQMDYRSTTFGLTYSTKF